MLDAEQRAGARDRLARGGRARRRRHAPQRQLHHPVQRRQRRDPGAHGRAVDDDAAAAVDDVEGAVVGDPHAGRLGGLDDAGAQPVDLPVEGAPSNGEVQRHARAGREPEPRLDAPEEAVRVVRAAERRGGVGAQVEAREAHPLPRGART